MIKSVILKCFIFCAFVCVSFSKTSDNKATETSVTEDLPLSYYNDGDSYFNDTSGNDTTAYNKQENNKRFSIFSMDFARIQTPMIIGLWIFCACLGKIVFHMAPKLSSMIPESCLLITMGLIIGGILVYANPNNHVSPLTADGFFLYLLPPIILDAGYFMPNRVFFDNLGTILVYAVLGTIWNTLTIGISLYALHLTGIFGPESYLPTLHIFLFAALISAVDPVAVIAVFEEVQVEEVLYILVFGESLLNDGVTVVLYHIFEGFNEIGEENIILGDIFSGVLSFILVAFGGSLIGIIWGFLTAFVTRFTHQVTVIEPLFIFVMSYLAYLNAELFHWSGILSITFCGITMKNYTELNMSDKSQTTTKYAMKMLASSSETVIFLFLGVATVHGTQHSFNVWFVLFAILFCSIYRVLGVLILTAACNRLRAQEIDFVQKFILSYGGLRGAIAFALVITIDPHHIPAAPMFVTTTIAVVFFTVFIQGITIKPLVDKLGVKRSSNRTVTMNERLHERSMDYIMVGIEDVVGKLGNYYVRGWFKRLNHNYLQPCLLREWNAREPKLFETLSHLQLEDAMNYMHQKPTSLSELESLSQVLHSNIYSRNSIKEWNLDVGEIEYKPGEKDLSDSSIHRILEDRYHFKGRRQSAYKRHAVNDEELGENTNDFRNRMYLYARQVAMSSMRNVRNRKGMKPGSQTDVMEGNRQIQQNGSTIHQKYDSTEVMAVVNPAYEEDEIVTVKKGKFSPSKRMSTKGPSVAETLLPWKRFTQDDVPASNLKIRRSMSIYPDEEIQDLPPTMAEVLLPWKRTEDEESFNSPVKQNEYPKWANNKEYIPYYSPSNTILGNIAEVDDTKPSIKEIFDHSQSSKAGGDQELRRKSLTDGMPSLRNSAKDDIYARFGPLKEDQRRRSGSLKDLKEFIPMAQGLQEHSRSLHHDSHPDRRSSRESLGFDSLLNTVIVEEDQSPPKSIRKPPTEHVINMNPAGESSENTDF